MVSSSCEKQVYMQYNFFCLYNSIWFKTHPLWVLQILFIIKKLKYTLWTNKFKTIWWLQVGKVHGQLNPLLAKWAMELVLISTFCSVKYCKWSKVFDSPGRNTNSSQVSSQQTLLLVYLPWKDGRLKRSHTTYILISSEPGIKLGTLWSEGRDPTNCASYACPLFAVLYLSYVVWHQQFC